MSVNQSLLDDNVEPGYYEVAKVNFLDKKIILKLENIGVYPGEKIYFRQFIKNSNVVLIKVNDVTYGIRANDAKNIIVKKVQE